MMSLIRGLVDRTGVAALVATHDVLLSGYAYRVLHLNDGQIQVSPLGRGSTRGGRGRFY